MVREYTQILTPAKTWLLKIMIFFWRKYTWVQFLQKTNSHESTAFTCESQRCKNITGKDKRIC